VEVAVSDPTAAVRVGDCCPIAGLSAGRVCSPSDVGLRVHHVGGGGGGGGGGRCLFWSMPGPLVLHPLNSSLIFELGPVFIIDYLSEMCKELAICINVAKIFAYHKHIFNFFYTKFPQIRDIWYGSSKFAFPNKKTY